MFLSVDETKIKVQGLPPPRANLLRQLCTKSGYLQVQEAGSKAWKSRYVVVKPTTFVYFFESERDTEPKGIVDLEYYTKVEYLGSEDGEVSPETIFRMAPEDKLAAAGLRSYLFDLEPTAGSGSPEERSKERNRWIRCLQSHRYDVLLQQRETLLRGLGDRRNWKDKHLLDRDRSRSALSYVNRVDPQRQLSRTSSIEEYLPIARESLGHLMEVLELLQLGSWQSHYLSPEDMDQSQVMYTLKSSSSKIVGTVRQQVADLAALRLELQALNMEKSSLSQEHKATETKLEESMKLIKELQEENKRLAEQNAHLEQSRAQLLNEVREVKGLSPITEHKATTGKWDKGTSGSEGPFRERSLRPAPRRGDYESKRDEEQNPGPKQGSKWGEVLNGVMEVAGRARGKSTERTNGSKR